MAMTLLDSCEACGVSWDDGDILERLRMTGHYQTEERVLEAAKSYGWTPETPKRFSRRIGIVENDRVVQWRCPDCGHRIPRQ